MDGTQRSAEPGMVARRDACLSELEALDARIDAALNEGDPASLGELVGERAPVVERLAELVVAAPPDPAVARAVVARQEHLMSRAGELLELHRQALAEGRQRAAAVRKYAEKAV